MDCNRVFLGPATVQPIRGHPPQGCKCETNVVRLLWDTSSIPVFILKPGVRNVVSGRRKRLHPFMEFAQASSDDVSLAVGVDLAGALS